MKKWMFFTNFEKEEKWLNEMAKQGYQIIKKSFYSNMYEFKTIEPENSIIKIDYRKFNKIEEYKNYLTLFEDSGWEHLAGTKKSGYQYFKKVDISGSDDIFSDVASKAGRYKRLSDMSITQLSFLLPIFAILIATDLIEPLAILNPKGLYYTPGLWERSGGDFTRAFLFETPFALFRGFLVALIPVTIVMYFVFAIKASSEYKKSINRWLH
ncbi:MULTISPECIES: DUF2812 domain-containing protein [unclassified Paenibacillus]|uniref:DUF2812 domain-containing protein n=1 Tax=unclassified Paenibacillus TaxID=185978 RepID=UPI0030FD1AB7